MATFQVEQHYCKEWFDQGKQLGQLWVLWRQSKERLDGNNTVQPILNETEKNSCSIILLDELFKGTNTIERIAAAKAVLSYLEKSDNKIFVSTHDIELTDLLREQFELFHFSEKIMGEKIQFDYKLKEGKPEKGNAIRILELNGFPKEIVEEAKELVAKS